MSAPRREDGFSIVEILVAMSLLIVGVLGVFGLFTKSQQSASTAQRHEVALAQAEKALEELRALPYDQLKLTTQPPAPLTPPDNDADVTDDDEPADRVVGDQFRPREGGNRRPTEDLVMFDDPEAGDAPAGVVPFSEVQVGDGTGMTMRVYRFVSWRDEECILTSVTNLSDTLEGLRETVNNLTGDDGLLRMLIGRIDLALLEEGKLGPVSSLLSATVKTLLNDVVDVLEDWKVTVTPFPSELDELLAQLDATLEGNTEPLGQRLDLCDLKALQSLDLKEIQAVNESLTVIGGIVNNMLQPVNDVTAVIKDLQNLNLLNATFKLTNAVTKLPGYLVTLTTGLNDLVGALSAFQEENGKTLLQAITDTTTTVENLLDFLNQPDTEKNTKRVTVAVWLHEHAQGNVGPMKPVWVSTVITDPDAGVL